MPTPMPYINAVELDIVPAEYEKFKAAILENAAASVKEPGCRPAILKVAWRRASFDFLGFEQFRGDREGGEGFEEDGP